MIWATSVSVKNLGFFFSLRGSFGFGSAESTYFCASPYQADDSPQITDGLRVKPFRVHRRDDLLNVPSVNLPHVLLIEGCLQPFQMTCDAGLG